MALTVTHAAAVPEDAALVAVGVRSDHLDEDAESADLPLLGAQGFEGKVGQTAARRRAADAPDGRPGPCRRSRAGACSAGSARRS